VAEACDGERSVVSVPPASVTVGPPPGMFETAPITGLARGVQLAITAPRLAVDALLGALTTRFAPGAPPEATGETLAIAWGKRSRAAATAGSLIVGVKTGTTNVGLSGTFVGSGSGGSRRCVTGLGGVTASGVGDFRSTCALITEIALRAILESGIGTRLDSETEFCLESALELAFWLAIRSGFEPSLVAPAFVGAAVIERAFVGLAFTGPTWPSTRFPLAGSLADDGPEPEMAAPRVSAKLPPELVGH